MEKIVNVVLLAMAFSLNAQTDYSTDNGFIVDGYDVVSYFGNSAKEGNDKYIANYDGIKFKFSSQKNLDTFNANPVKYVPQYGGYCAYALAVKNKKVSVDPETFEIRDGKLYLFYNSWGSNALESWLDESPDVLKLKADENWKKLN